MSPKLMGLLIAVALVAPAGVVMAHHNEDHGQRGNVPSMPDASIFGLCTAWQHNEKGRENGNAGNAGPFRWLQQQADENDQSVEEYCADRAPGGPP